MFDEASQTFIIDRRFPPVSKSTDRIRVFYKRDEGPNHFAAAHGPVYIYHALNLRNNHAYAVSLFLSESRSMILASCTCPARKMCKHIAEAWRVHDEVVQAGFIPAFETVEIPPLEDDQLL